MRVETCIKLLQAPNVEQLALVLNRCDSRGRLFCRGLLNEDEALALILRNTGSNKSKSSRSQKTTPPDSAQGSPVDPGPLSRRSKRAVNKAAASSPLARVPEEERRCRFSRKGGSVETDDADSVERAAAVTEEEQTSSETSQDLTSSNSEQNAGAAAAAGELSTTRDSTSGDDSFDVYAMVDESVAGPGAWRAIHHFPGIPSHFKDWL